MVTGDIVKREIVFRQLVIQYCYKSQAVIYPLSPNWTSHFLPIIIICRWLCCVVVVVVGVLLNHCSSFQQQKMIKIVKRTFLTNNSTNNSNNVLNWFYFFVSSCQCYKVRDDATFLKIAWNKVKWQNGKIKTEYGARLTLFTTISLSSVYTFIQIKSYKFLCTYLHLVEKN